MDILGVMVDPDGPTMVHIRGRLLSLGVREAARNSTNELVGRDFISWGHCLPSYRELTVGLLVGGLRVGGGAVLLAKEAGRALRVVDIPGALALGRNDRRLSFSLSHLDGTHQGLDPGKSCMGQAMMPE